MNKLCNYLSLVLAVSVLLLTSGCETDSVDPAADAPKEESAEGTLTFLDEEEGADNTRVGSITHATEGPNPRFNDLTWNTNDDRRVYTGWGQLYGCQDMSRVDKMVIKGTEQRIYPYKYHYKTEVVIYKGGSLTMKVFPTVHLDKNCNPTRADRNFVAYLSVEKKTKSGNWSVQYSSGEPSYKSVSWKTGQGYQGKVEIGAGERVEKNGRREPIDIPEGAFGDCERYYAPRFRFGPNQQVITIPDYKYDCYYQFPGELFDAINPAPVRELGIYFKQWGSGEYRVKAIVTTQGKQKRLTAFFRYNG